MFLITSFTMFKKTLITSILTNIYLDLLKIIKIYKIRFLTILLNISNSDKWFKRLFLEHKKNREINFTV